MTAIRRLTSEGLDRMHSWLDQVKEAGKGDVPETLLVDPALAGPVRWAVALADPLVQEELQPAQAPPPLRHRWGAQPHAYRLVICHRNRLLRGSQVRLPARRICCS